MSTLTTSTAEVKIHPSINFEKGKINFRALSDNMNSGKISDTPKGAILVTSEIDPDQWPGELIPNKFGYVIIQKKELHKDIISYDPDTKIAICSNRNPEAIEKTFSLSLKGAKIFQVLKRSY